MLTLTELNDLPAARFVELLANIYEHSPWVPGRAAAFRPFGSVLALQEALQAEVMNADESAQLALIRAHPALAGRAAIGTLTANSSREQQGAGLNACTPAQYARLLELNAAYEGRFGFPFILAVKGHTVDSIIAEMQHRLAQVEPVERATALAQIGRIARFRLADLIAEDPGSEILSRADELARHSESEHGLTCSYLSRAHRATAALIRDYMLAAGLTVRMDAVGNVVGTLAGGGTTRQALLTGSHYDTVINAGRYDGRLGILLPITVAAALRRRGLKLPYDLTIIGFAEEEGVRFKSTFLGSRALAGRFEPALLAATDEQGITMRQALEEAGLGASTGGRLQASTAHGAAKDCPSSGTGEASEAAHMEAIAAERMDAGAVLGFVEVHIEQGPVLLHEGLPVGVVSGIAGSLRSLLTVTGRAGHSGTVPMDLRHDAAAGAAEMVLAVERRCRGIPGLVGTVGQLTVPGGAVNVIPGRCELSLDVRSGSDAVRDAAAADIAAEVAAIATRRGLEVTARPVLSAGSVECVPELRRCLAQSIERVTGSAARTLPSGAGHDAMMMANLCPVGMLFVRCGNGGISHHPDEALAAEDAAVAAAVFEDFLLNFPTPA